MSVGEMIFWAMVVVWGTYVFVGLGCLLLLALDNRRR